MTKNQQVALRIPAEMRAALERLAADEERSMSFLAMNAIEAMLIERGYLEREKPKRARKAAA